MNQTCEGLRFSNNFIKEKKDKGFITDNDGVFSIDEVKWGKHLVNFDADHLQLAGIGEGEDYQKLLRLIIDHVKYI